jgi:prepilin signal peptidase PulO-like enzyme (type II secretory pathway)
VTGQLVPPPALAASIQGQLHAEFLAHAILILLMTVGTFIDFDEQTIPDSITIPGTILGLLLAASLPMSLLPQVTMRPPPPMVSMLMLSSPQAWPAWLDGPRGLSVGCAIFVGWCLALIPATCTLRRGLFKGVQFYLASALRGREWWKLLLLAAIGCGGIVAVWFVGGPRWQALMTALTGLAFGGLLVWSVRIVGRAALHKEAMGFGDVTLMAMIGAFLGWQTTLVVFFLSPAAALFIAVTQWILTGRRDIAFGPYLCLAAVFAIVCWPAVWIRVGALFAMGWLVPALFGACLLLMMAMLMFWRFVEELMTRDPRRR